MMEIHKKKIFFQTAKAFDVDCTLAEDSCFGDVAKLAKRLEEKYVNKFLMSCVTLHC